ncbi:MAG: asparagine synthase-related protein [Thermoguttaceae bacterium]|jgi:asparagine synthetase B (glutamine-hydrolysing)|nr:asparagine synthase-related protein [Thermoguttaceae bacterium]
MADPYMVIRKIGSEIRADGMMSFRAGSQPNGPYVEWRWNGHDLHVANDQYGLWPAYYSTFLNGFAISTSIPQLTEVLETNELDYTGLAGFFRLGYFLGDRTAIRGIRALPPSVEVKWNSGSPEVRGSRHVYREESRLSRDAAIDGYIDLFAQSIRRCLPDGPCAVPLSGGRDSRHIALELTAAGHVPEYCVTVEGSGEDLPVAAALAKAAELRHHTVETNAYGFPAECRKNILTGFGTTEHRWMLAITDFLANKVQFIYDGLAGDVLSAGHFATREALGLFRTNRLHELAALLLPNEDKTSLKRLLSSETYRRCNREVAIAELEYELGQYVDHPNPIATFSLANRTRRVAALSPLCLARQAGTVFCPYMDPDVVEFLLALPAETFLDHGFHTDAIHRRFPAFKHIPFAKKRQSIAFQGHLDVTRTSRQLPDYRTFARQLLYYTYVQQRPPRILCSPFVFPRLARAAVDNRYARASGWLLIRTCYLVQLERLCLGELVSE